MIYRTRRKYTASDKTGPRDRFAHWDASLFSGYHCPYRSNVHFAPDSCRPENALEWRVWVVSRLLAEAYIASACQVRVWPESCRSKSGKDRALELAPTVKSGQLLSFISKRSYEKLGEGR